MPYHKSDTSKIKPQKKTGPKVPRKITETYLHNSGMYYLERFAASRAHFITVMSRKAKRSCMHHKEQNYDDCVELVRALADKFERLGLLNDEAYTSTRVMSLRRKGLSQNAIVMKMREKGIGFEQTVQALNKIEIDQYETSADAEFAAALRLARKKRIGPYFAQFGKTENIQRSLGMLARAGFSYQVAQKVINTPIEDIDQIHPTFI